MRGREPGKAGADDEHAARRTLRARDVVAKQQPGGAEHRQPQHLAAGRAPSRGPNRYRN